MTYKLDGKDAASVIEPGGREATLTLTPGSHKLTALVTDDKGRVATKTEASITAK